MFILIRIIPQLISLELIWTTIILIFIRSWNELSIAIYRFIIPLSLLVRYSFLINCLWLVCYRFISNHHLFAIFFFICISGESNRVPHDLPEAEPESVAGFITEYSPVISPLILSTEYANIIAVSFRIMIPFPLNYDRFIFFPLFVRLIRTTSNRSKFDELMTNARIVIPPVISSLLLSILYWISYPLSPVLGYVVQYLHQLLITLNVVSIQSQHHHWDIDLIIEWLLFIFLSLNRNQFWLLFESSQLH